MTLIMSLLSRDYVIQVSDRRFLWFEPDDKVRRIDDESNKSVLWAHLNAFAFTGIGNLGVKHRTDLWLARHLAKVEGGLPAEQADQGHVFRAIAEAATEYFNGPRIARIDRDLRRHAFVAVGWSRENDDSEFLPHMVRIGNFTAGGPAGERFQISVERIRRVSSRNEAVGRGLLVTVLPRASISQGESGGMLIAAPAHENTQTFLYVPADDRQGIVYGPTVVSGGAVLADFMAGSLDAPEMADLKRARRSKSKSRKFLRCTPRF